MTLPPQTRFASRRALILYVGTIVLPGLVLIYLGYQGARQQQAALESLARTSERFSTEQLAHEIEQEAMRLAERCLLDAQRSEAIPLIESGDDPYTQREIGIALQAVLGRHPIAAALYLVSDGGLRYPLIQTPPKRSLDSIARGESPAQRRVITTLLADAEQVEIRDRNPVRASRIYQTVFDRASTPPVKALALARLARCAEQIGDVAGAAHVRQRLVDQFPDEYNPYHHPHALAAVVAAGGEGPAAGRGAAAGSDGTMALLRGVPAGRWELSAELADYYVEILRRRGGDAGDTGQAEQYLAWFAVADAVGAAARRLGARAGDRTPYAETVSAAGQTHLAMFAPPGAGAGQDRRTAVALVVSLDWVQAHLVPDHAKSRGAHPPLVIPVTGQSGGGSRPGDTSAPFRELFRFWRLELSPETVAEARATIRRGTWIIAGATSIVFAMLAAGVLLLARDVRREAEVSQLKSDFVSGVSHELKTPLTLIRLYGETLSADPGAPADERQGYYDIITRESVRLTTLIDQVLDFSRIERGKKTYRLTVGDLRRVVDDTLESYGTYLRRRGFDTALEIRTPPPVQFDGGAVAEALVNLLDNAVKYSGESRWIRVGLGGRGAEAILEVEDRGIGIAEADRPHIFSQFVRAGRQTGKGGYGLGLFLLKHIMDAHGGRIEVESEVGKGSVFRLVFPGLPARAHAAAGEVGAVARDAVQS